MVDQLPDTIEEVREQLAEITKVKGDSSNAPIQVLENMENKLLRKLTTLTKEERKLLQAKIEVDHEGNGLKFKIVTQVDFDAALEKKSTDPRANTLMEKAGGLGVELAPDEMIVIKKGSGVDKSVSETLSKEWKDDLEALGGEFVVQASRGSVSGGGTRGDLTSYPAGTTLTKTYKGENYAAEIVDRDGSKIIVGTAGDGIKGVDFTSLSGAAQAVTGYNVRGTQWWVVSTPKD